MLTHHNILNNGYWVGERLRLTHHDRIAFQCHSIIASACSGKPRVCDTWRHNGASAPHFSPQQTLEAVALERCTALYGVPTMFIAELDHPRFREFDLSTLRTGIMAGRLVPSR